MASAMPITAGQENYTSLPQAKVEPAGRNAGIAFFGSGETGGSIHECVPVTPVRHGPHQEKQFSRYDYVFTPAFGRVV
jgi:hypothetical protein